MAILKLGPTIACIRGTVDGLVYSASLTGPYVRAWTKPRRTLTQPRATVHNRLARMANRWRSLSSAQRADWDAYAAAAAQTRTNSCGESYNTSGFAWQVGINLGLTQTSQTLRDAAPTLTRPAAPSGITAIFTAGSLILEYPVDPYGAATRSVIYAAPKSSIGAALPRAQFRYIIDVTQPNDEQLVITTAYTTVWGTYQTGDDIAVAILTQDAQGQRSSLFYTSDVV